MPSDVVTARARMLVGVVLAVLLGAGTLVGCSGDSGKPKASPATTLAAAKRKLDATSGVHLGLSTPKLPSGVSGLLKADGVGTHAPAFDGTIKVAASGITADAAVVAVGGDVYAKLPFTTRYAKIDPASYGAPDPAKLLGSHGGLSSLLTSAKDVKEGKKVREGKVVSTSYTGTVPGTAVSAVIPSASAKADFDATFVVTDDHELTKAVLTGPFYPQGGDVTYTITFDHYGTTKNITAP
jgi:lipoprotein LprG